MKQSPYKLSAAQRAVIRRYYTDKAFREAMPWSEHPSGNGKAAPRREP